MLSLGRPTFKKWKIKKYLRNERKRKNMGNLLFITLSCLMVMAMDYRVWNESEERGRGKGPERVGKREFFYSLSKWEENNGDLC